jgi:hypothetical protein
VTSAGPAAIKGACHRLPEHRVAIVTPHARFVRLADAWDTASGKSLWHSQIGGLSSPPETFLLNGRQHMLFTGAGGQLSLFVLN